MKYTSKPITIEAEKYSPPTDIEDYHQVISDLADFAGARIDCQVPWNPAEGQDCLLLRFDPQPVAHDVESGEPTAYTELAPQLVKPGDYVVKTDAAPFVIDGQKFEAIYDVTAEVPATTDAGAHADTDQPAE